METICENVIDMVTGLEEYFLCSVTNQKCCFQRYCSTEERVINTEGAKVCKARARNDAVENIEEKEQTVIPEIKNNDVSAPKKEKGTVTLVTNTYVVYDINGKSCYKTGRFNVKIGDKIEV